MPRQRKIEGMILAAFCLLGADSAPANLVREPTYQEKMARAQLVVIGTVTAVSGSSVTVTVVNRLKGESPDIIAVGTYTRIEEMAVQCCDVGATYLMFLASPRNGGQYFSVWGRFGIIRIGAPRNEQEAIPSREN